MEFEIIIAAITLLVGFGEFFVWYSEIQWHRRVVEIPRIGRRAEGRVQAWL